MQFVVTVSWRENLRQLILVLADLEGKKVGEKEAKEFELARYYLEGFYKKHLPFALDTVLDKSEGQVLKSYVWRVETANQTAGLWEIEKALAALTGPLP